LPSHGFQPASAPARNAYAINTGDRLYLVDTGVGSLTGMGPTLGHLAGNLAAAGIAPHQVDTVLITHLHIDHIGGLSKDGAVLFPRAEPILPETAAAFWSRAGRRGRGPGKLRPVHSNGAGRCGPYAARARKIASSGVVAPGVEALPFPGRTPGHAGYLISSGNSRLLIWGDIVHNAALQFPHPEWTATCDIDRPQAAVTRKRVFDMAAQERVIIAGMHLPLPGLGYVVRDGKRYQFHQISWECSSLRHRVPEHCERFRWR